MVIALALLSARPGHENDVESELRSLLAATSREDGVRGYSIARDPENRGRFVVYECYADASARAEHFASPHLRAALERLEPALLAEAPVVRFLDEIASLSG
jgi:quinol monooxygenase YgiN